MGRHAGGGRGANPPAPAKSYGRRASQFVYATGETPHVGDTVETDSVGERLTVRAVDDWRWHVVASGRETGAHRLPANACALVGRRSHAD